MSSITLHHLNLHLQTTLPFLPCCSINLNFPSTCQHNAASFSPENSLPNPTFSRKTGAPLKPSPLTETTLEHMLTKWKAHSPPPFLPSISYSSLISRIYLLPGKFYTISSSGQGFVVKLCAHGISSPSFLPHVLIVLFMFFYGYFISSFNYFCWF